MCPRQTAGVAPSRETSRRRRNIQETDDVVKPAVKIIRRETHAIVSQFLIDAGVKRSALLRRKRRIAGKTRIVSERLIESRFDDALPVRGVQPSVAKRALRDAQSVGSACARNDARAEVGIILGARADVERQPRDRLPARVEKARLIVAPRVRPTELRKPFSTSYS